MKEIAEILFSVLMYAFVVSSMVSTGLGLTISQIIEPFKNIKMVILASIANFVIAPLYAYGIMWVFPVSEGLRIGLILLSLSAGAAFIPKIAEAAKARLGGAVGLMLLLLLLTIFLLPIIVPYLFPSASITSWELAKSLVITLFIPLATALFVRARYSNFAKRIQPFFTKSTNIIILLLGILVLYLDTKMIISNASAIPIILLFFLGAMAVGYFTGGKNRNARIILSIGTGLRNPPVAMLVAGQYFSSEPMALVTPMLGMIIGLSILFPLAIRISKNA